MHHPLASFALVPLYYVYCMALAACTCIHFARAFSTAMFTCTHTLRDSVACRRFAQWLCLLLGVFTMLDLNFPFLEVVSPPPRALLHRLTFRVRFFIPLLYSWLVRS